MKPLDHMERAKRRRTPNNTIRDNTRRSQVPLSPATGVPVCTVVEYAGAALPTDEKWLWADGSKYAEADYPDLAEALAGAFNDGTEAAGEFSVPNHIGRVGVGAGARTGLTTRAVGDEWGEENHILVVSQLPPHTHAIRYNNPANGVASGSAARHVMASGGSETHNTESTGGTGGTTEGHPNFQPSIGINFIIKAIP